MHTPFNKKITLLLATFCAVISLGGTLFAAPLQIVTSTAELADLTKSIGKDAVVVIPLVIKNWDIHHVEPRPSMVVSVRKADMLIRNGMSLDIWLDSVLTVARNERVMVGGDSYVDASIGVTKLDIPTGAISQAMGDVHRQGNPHYLLDPRNVLIVSKTIKDALIKKDPSHANYYQKNYEDFIANYSKKLVVWNEKIKVLKGKKAVTYHKTWVYFFKYSGVELAGTLEPVPGIPPTPGHIAKIKSRLQKGDVSYIILSPYYSDKEAKILAKDTNIKFLSLPTSVEIGSKDYGTYTQMIDTIINDLIK